VKWLVASLVVSVVLTVVLNIAVRSFPGATDRLARNVTRLGSPSAADESRVRVVVPWRAMLLGSLILTVIINAWIRLT
jgi:hypothetical protein